MQTFSSGLLVLLIPASMEQKVSYTFGECNLSAQQGRFSLSLRRLRSEYCNNERQQAKSLHCLSFSDNRKRRQSFSTSDSIWRSFCINPMTNLNTKHTEYDKDSYYVITNEAQDSNINSKYNENSTKATPLQMGAVTQNKFLKI